MPLLTDLDIRPSLLLAMWAAGMAAGIALVAWKRIVGAAFVWIAGGFALAVAAFTVFGGPWPIVGTVLLAVGVVAARRPTVSVVALAASSIVLLVHAASFAGIIPALLGAAALGGVTCEMLLAHWYLVDPTLPRSVLRGLCATGIAGLIGEVVLLSASGVWGIESAVLMWAWVALVAFSILAMVGAWFSLREAGYEGVMSATGLSYLAVLTALGAVGLGRVLLVA